jgi:hypothetical protein
MRSAVIPRIFVLYRALTAGLLLSAGDATHCAITAHGCPAAVELAYIVFSTLPTAMYHP